LSAIIDSTISNRDLDSGVQVAGMKPFARINEGCRELRSVELAGSWGSQAVRKMAGFVVSKVKFV
jgi:hypothetical protein